MAIKVINNTSVELKYTAIREPSQQGSLLRDGTLLPNENATVPVPSDVQKCWVGYVRVPSGVGLGVTTTGPNGTVYLGPTFIQE